MLNGAEDLGKPCGQDAAHGRPNAVADFGRGRARSAGCEDILGGAIASIPACPGEAMLCAIVRKQAERLTPVAPPATWREAMRCGGAAPASRLPDLSGSGGGRGATG